MPASRQAYEAMAADRDFSARVLEADLEFHMAIVDATHNRFFVTLGQAVKTALRVSFSLLQSRPGIPENELVLHSAIADAIVAGRGEEAAPDDARPHRARPPQHRQQGQPQSLSRAARASRANTGRWMIADSDRTGSRSIQKDDIRGNAMPAHSTAAKVTRAPAIPLVTIDPHTSVWCFADKLTDDWSRHWTGSKMALYGVDPHRWRMLPFHGRERVARAAAEQIVLRRRGDADHRRLPRRAAGA